MRRDSIKRRRKESDKEKTEKKKVRNQFVCVCVSKPRQRRVSIRNKDKEIKNGLFVMAVSYSRTHRGRSVSISINRKRRRPRSPRKYPYQHLLSKLPASGCSHPKEIKLSYLLFLSLVFCFLQIFMPCPCQEITLDIPESTNSTTLSRMVNHVMINFP